MFELKFIAFGLMFFLLFGVLLEFFVNENTNAGDFEANVDAVLENDTWFNQAVYNIAKGSFGIFGIDLGGELAILPTWLNSLLSAFATLLLLTFLMWIFQNVGQVLPFT